MKKTTQAQAVRGFDTPEQSSAIEAARKIEDLSFKLHNLAEVVKLAGFSAEARRTLSAIYSLAQVLPEVGQNITQCVNAPDAWRDRHDNTGDVLFYVADELDSIRDGFEDSRAALVRLSSPSEAAQAATQEGGAA